MEIVNRFSWQGVPCLKYIFLYNLTKKFGDFAAVDDVSFHVEQGETLGLVGESGCGKTTTGRCILQLYKVTDGNIFFDGRELTTLDEEELRIMRRDMQLIFQATQH